MPDIQIRNATIEDAALILGFIKELATYEKAAHEVIATVDDVKTTLFGTITTTKAVICTADDKPIGFAVYFLNYSTWLGQHGLYLEDLYISPTYRGIGAGKMLLQYLAKLVVANNYGRFEWRVLDWNEPSIKFYEAMGAVAQSEWIGYRLEGKALTDFANS